MPSERLAGKTVWITGAGGLIGHTLLETAPSHARGANIVALTREQLELTDFDAVRARFRACPPDVVIHCAALTQPAACRANPALAYRLNVEVTALLAELTAERAMVFFSTDLVFDGQHGRYDESAAVNPLSVYAQTKLAAERIVLANPRHTVIRTSLTGGISPTGDRGFNEQLRRAWAAGQSVRLFTDEFRCPLPATVTARAVWELIAQEVPGLYHVAGRERLSRWEMGLLVAARWPQLNPRIEPASRLGHAGEPRPADTSLHCAKAQRVLSFPLPGLSEWLHANPTAVF